MNGSFNAITPASWITISRFFLVPLVLLPLLTGGEDGEILAFILFLVAALSDSLDGFVARRFNQVSALGKFLDPLADKLLISSLLLVLVFRGLAPIPATGIIILRELVVVVWRWRALRQGYSFSASVAAKIKTDSQLAGIALLLIFPYLPGSGLVYTLVVVAIHLGALMAIYSALDYLPLRRSGSGQTRFQCNRWWRKENVSRT
jgi:CDP-diacylglycerol---glycerol-3-phosphate 3-phosphatidyltransferase